MKQKSEISGQLQILQSYIDDIPRIIDPCKICDVYKKHGESYDCGHEDEHGGWIEGTCKHCCWYYPSNFKTGGAE